MITIGGNEQYKGTVVTKPVLSRDLMINGDTHVVVIGDEAWVGQSGEPLKSVPAAMATGMFAAFDPTLLVGAFSGAAVGRELRRQGHREQERRQRHALPDRFDDRRRPASPGCRRAPRSTSGSPTRATSSASRRPGSRAATCRSR